VTCDRSVVFSGYSKKTDRHDISEILLKVALNSINLRKISLSVTCGRSLIFSEYFGFLHQSNWPPRYSWNIVESSVKHHNPTHRNITRIPRCGMQPLWNVSFCGTNRIHNSPLGQGDKGRFMNGDCPVLCPCQGLGGLCYYDHNGPWLWGSNLRSL
jgi:hypothetical protein